MSILWLHNEPQPDAIMATDASKKGFGGITGQQYFRGRFPVKWQDKNIAELEMRAVLVALKIWAGRLEKLYFWVQVDNEAVATVINSGGARDPVLQDALREIALLAAKYQFMIKAKHISGVSNRIPDWLSRWHEPEARKAFREFAKDKSLNRCKVTNHHLYFNNKW